MFELLTYDPESKNAAQINRAACGVICSLALMPDACKYQGFAEFIQVLYIAWGILSSCRKNFGFECGIL